MLISQYELILRESKTYEWTGSNRKKFDNAESIYRFVTYEGTLALGSRPEEHIITLAINVKGELIGLVETGIGDISSACFSPRQCLMFGLQSGAAGLFVVHNHPSQDTTFSQEDIMAARRLKDACDIMGVKLVDFLAVSNSGYSSMMMEGLI